MTKYVGEAYDKLLNIYKDNYMEKNIHDKINLNIILSKKYDYLLNIVNTFDNTYLTDEHFDLYSYYFTEYF